MRFLLFFTLVIIRLKGHETEGKTRVSMEVSLESIQELAPDQSSLSAAKKLLKKQKWPSVGKSEEHKTIWGVCQGSGSNPYYTMADLSNLGYKCTCPSRKFPCKHVLALLWQFSEQLHDFQDQELPQWVVDWHSRRRKTAPTNQPEKPAVTSANKDINNVIVSDDIVHSEKDEQLKRKRAESLRAKTDKLIASGLEELQQWMEDQLKSGINQFLKDIHNRCRNISARLIDSKASNLGVKLDELPGKVLDYPIEEQPSVVIREFGRLVMLCNAWFANNNDMDVRRDIAMAEKKEDVIQAKASVVSGIWQTIGEQSYTRRDGLITQTTWLLHLGSDMPKFAKLVDHFPAATGRNKVGAGFKSCLHGELVYYSSSIELRGVLQNYELLPKPHTALWSANSIPLAEHFLTLQSRIPWLDHIPYVLADGRIVMTQSGDYWWLGKRTDERYLLSNNDIQPVLLGCIIDRAFIIWDGNRGQLLSVITNKWGAQSC